MSRPSIPSGLPWFGPHPAQLLRPVVVRAVLLVLLCALTVSSQQLWKIDHDVIFIPQDGLALSTMTGRMLWRYPRFQGSTVSDGAGLLMVSYLDGINHKMHVRSTRLCRLNTQSGHEEWCQSVMQLRSWVLDASRRFIYVQRDDHMDVLDIEHGRPVYSFLLHDHEGDLYPLPQGGVLLLDNGPTRTIAGLYHPGDAEPEWRTFPMYLHPFQGNGRGLLLYASGMGEFFSPALQPLYRQPAEGSFPKAGSSDQGFVFTDQQDRQAVLRGGTYSGPMWQSEPGDQPHSLFVRGRDAIVLEPVHDGGDTTAGKQARLRLLDLPTGHLRLQIELPAGLRFGDCDDRGLLLHDNAHMLLVDLNSGAVKWQIEQGADSAILSDTAVIFWNNEGMLLGRARTNGALLWRDRFQFGSHPH